MLSAIDSICSWIRFMPWIASSTDLRPLCDTWDAFCALSETRRAFWLASCAVCFTSSTVAVVSLTAVAVSAAPEATWVVVARISLDEEAIWVMLSRSCRVMARLSKEPMARPTTMAKYPKSSATARR